MVHLGGTSLIGRRSRQSDLYLVVRVHSPEDDTARVIVRYEDRREAELAALRLEKRTGERHQIVAVGA